MIVYEQDGRQTILRGDETMIPTMRLRWLHPLVGENELQQAFEYQGRTIWRTIDEVDEAFLNIDRDRAEAED